RKGAAGGVVFRALRKRFLIPAVALAVLAGCASDPARRENIVKEHSAKPMEMVDDVANDAAKASVAKDLEARIQERMRPILKRWSGATRFFAGAFAGDSSIAMDLQLRDAATGAVVANPTIVRNASAFAGAYSVGSTDQ